VPVVSSGVASARRESSSKDRSIMGRNASTTSVIAAPAGRERIRAQACRHTDCGIDPDRRGRRQTVDAFTASKNRARPEKPNAGHDLSGYAIR